MYEKAAKIQQKEDERVAKQLQREEEKAERQRLKDEDKSAKVCSSEYAPLFCIRMNS